MPDARNTDRRATVGGTGLVAAFAAARVAPSDARDAAEATTRVDVAESVACIGKGAASGRGADECVAVTTAICLMTSSRRRVRRDRKKKKADENKNSTSCGYSVRR